MSETMLERSQFVKELVLSRIADDYESFEHITDSLSRLPGASPRPEEIREALAALIADGSAASYYLSPQPPHVTRAEFSQESIANLWFYVTPLGKAAAWNLDQPVKID
jgi:hypothetical protein